MNNLIALNHQTLYSMKRKHTIQQIEHINHVLAFTAKHEREVLIEARTSAVAHRRTQSK